MSTNAAPFEPGHQAREETPKEASVQSEPAVIDRDMAVAGIRAGLRQRCDRAWSVRAGRGTVANWITIIAPPARLGPGRSMTPQDCAALAALLALDYVHPQGVIIEPSPANWHEYLMRARGAIPIGPNLARQVAPTRCRAGVPARLVALAAWLARTRRTWSCENDDPRGLGIARRASR